MTRQERNAKIESFGRAFRQLTDVLQQYPKEMWKFKPTPTQWSIHQIILHIADTESHAYTRFRTFIAEPGATIMAFDQDKWASQLNYHQLSPEDALELFRIQRKMNYELIRNLPEHYWSRAVVHSEKGNLQLDEWLNFYESYVPKHIDQMKKTAALWKLAARGRF